MIINYDQDETIYNIVIVGENKSEYSEFIEMMLKNSQTPLQGPRVNIVFSDNYFDVFEEMAYNKFDLIIIDVDHPNGKNFLFKINDRGSASYPTNVMMILIGSDGKEEAKMNAIDSGFDDYACKPLNTNEFASRIRLLLRKIKKKNKISNKQILKVGDITMNALIRTVNICNRGAKISTKEFNILKLFLENPDKVFSRKEILEKIWDNSEKLSVRIVDVHINRLRIALGSNRSNRSYIRTVRGYGYSLDVYDSDYREIKKDSYTDMISSISNHGAFNGYAESYNNSIGKFLQPNN
jgi:DNA-binding response OmpR family regulator